MYSWLIGLVGLAIMVGLALWVFTSWRFLSLATKSSECVQELKSENIQVSDEEASSSNKSDTEDNKTTTGGSPEGFLPQKTRSELVRGAAGAVLGRTSMQEKASRILSRIGTMRPEPLASREAFMRGVLPAAKRSKYMIPVQL